MLNTAVARTLLLMAWLVVPAIAAAQAPDATTTETNRGPIVPFLEGTDVFVTSDDGVVFEAGIFPHLVVAQNYTDMLRIDPQARAERKRKRFAYAISGTPAVRLRMFEEVSRPVRTPSYMPRGNVQILFSPNIEQALGALLTRDAGTTVVSFWEGHAIVGHHSNGQDGCLYTDQIRVDELCITDPLIPPVQPREINRRDGSFSTNYIRVGANYRRSLVDSTMRTFGHWSLRAEIEQHPRAWMDEEITELYGRTRLGVGASAARSKMGWCRKRLDGSAFLQYIHGAPDEVWPVTISVEAACFPTENGGWGLFARFYGGQDYYNLGFLDNITRMHVGVTYNQDGFFRFLMGPP